MIKKYVITLLSIVLVIYPLAVLANNDQLAEESEAEVGFTGDWHRPDPPVPPPTLPPEIDPPVSPPTLPPAIDPPVRPPSVDQPPGKIPPVTPPSVDGPPIVLPATGGASNISLVGSGALLLVAVLLVHKGVDKIKM